MISTPRTQPGRIGDPASAPIASSPGRVVPFVSVVVPVYNGEATIEACVRSLLAQDYPRSRYEIIVADNGSSDRTREIVRRLPTVRVVEERSRRGSYAARNRGIQASRGECIAFTDSDCAADRGWLTHLVEGFEDPSVGACAGRVVAADPATTLERFAKQRGQVSQDVSMRCAFLPIAITANVAYRRSLLDALGRFDDRMISSGDVELAWRLQLECGKTIRFNRAAVVRHKHRGTMRQFWRQHRVYGYGTAMLYQRFPGYRKSLAAETLCWMGRVGRFSLRGLARLAQVPFRPRAGRLYFLEHFLEILCTTSRFTGVVRYHLERKPHATPRRGPHAADGGALLGVVPSEAKPSRGTTPRASIVVTGEGDAGC